MVVTLKKMKECLRVDYDDEDDLIRQLIKSAGGICMAVLRTDSEEKLKSSVNGKVAVMYAAAYLYEHREEADHHALMLTLRSLLFGSMREVFSDGDSPFECAGKRSNEPDVAGTVVDNSDISFTVRWCKKVSIIDSTEYRLLFENEIYDILAVDHVNYKKKCIEFKCRKARR